MRWWRQEAPISTTQRLGPYFSRWRGLDRHPSLTKPRRTRKPKRLRVASCASRLRDEPSLMFTAVALAAAAVGTHRLAVGAEGAQRLDAPVRRGVVHVVEFALVRIRHRRHVHALVTKIQAV